MMMKKQLTEEALKAGIDNLLGEYKSMIKDSLDGEWDEFPFDEEFWALVAPMKARGSLIGYVDEIAGEGGKLTSAKFTRSETKVLVEHYLKKLDDIYHYEAMQNGTSSSWMRMKVYANKRINDLVESRSITEGCVSEMSDRIFNCED
jgi:hypothetical protein